MANKRSNNGLLTGEGTSGSRDIEVGTNTNNGHDVEIEQWAHSLSRMLEDVPQYMCTPGYRGRISRIPENIREADVKAYEPYFLSIGPYHHAKPMVQSMEMTKRLVLKCVLEVKPELSLRDYLNGIKSIEPVARSFYSGLDMESEKFVHMLLVDSMYILTSFCGLGTNQGRRNQRTERTSDTSNEGDNENKNMMAEGSNSNDDTCPDTTLLFSTPLQHDLFLLENQLPFFVLQKIYALVYDDSETQLISIMKHKVADLLLGYTKLDPEMIISQTTEVHHLLHLCHRFFHPTIQQECTASHLPESNHMFRLGSAMQLYETGVSFVARSQSAEHSLLDIIFSSGKMVMPSLCVDDNTNSLLRNLIALEQMKYPSMGLNVSAYAVLLLHLVTTPEDAQLHLVTTPEDAQLLRRKEVIQHHLASDKEMMYLVNKLSVGLSFDYVEDIYNLKPVFQELNRYSEHRVPRWQAWLKHKYFNNPWTVLSLLAESILLILSIVETFYTVYSYYHPYFDGRS